MSIGIYSTYETIEGEILAPKTLRPIDSMPCLDHQHLHLMTGGPNEVNLFF